ncbi:unnamed protein product [Rotaria sp. Silwood1]|nr:unnamed protein product [Rotaria sp. Silwood1]CAF1619206.1 unnamed protein product [Rotaria sp. Silwood1]
MTEKNPYAHEPFNPPKPPPQVDTRTFTPPRSVEVVSIDEIVLNIRFRNNRDELKKLIIELMEPNKHLKLNANGERVSTLHQYALVSTREPIDMSNQRIRTTYRPNLFIRKNDAFGPWNFNYLLNLLEIDYQCEGNKDFPEVWKTSSTTKVRIEPHEIKTTDPSSTASVVEEDDVRIEDLLKKICLLNKRDENEANEWKKSLNSESISTVEHLREAVTNEYCWDKITSIKSLVKQMIRDYVQLKAASHTFNAENNTYDKSTATLLGDIHRVRRYFHHVIETDQYIPYLDREAVDTAIREIRLVYNDDGNVLNNIHAYLRTFCLQTNHASKEAQNQKNDEWTEKRNQLIEQNKGYNIQIDRLRETATTKQILVDGERMGYERAIKERDKEKATTIEELFRKAAANSTDFATSLKLRDQARKMEEANDKKVADAKHRLEKAEKDLAPFLGPIKELEEKIVENNRQIRDLDAYLKIDLAVAHQMLKVKFGRGLLLYGPPGTGKSEILKRAATYAGITMTTTALAAGELNRPYVGETERLLVDIMYRAKTIPYLICTMTIDEIDGLVPKRDNNAQQSKVDGISVLLSHIEGVKNIPNLIVFGATNRRNMMDEAFLRRMQAKCFVGRPSPQIRKKMLEVLLVKDTTRITSQRIDFLVKVTTNFSGAAVGALKSSIIVAIEQCQESSVLTDNTLLDLADNAAREFSCWFGISTLPEICRLYPNVISSTEQQEQYSLKFLNHSPSGRILVDLQERKCLIELTNDTTLEKTLFDEETSTLTLLSRFINGCSSRNIDTIQIIDLNFLTKNNAFDEKQIFELLTTTFLGNILATNFTFTDIVFLNKRIRAALKNRELKFKDEK